MWCTARLWWPGRAILVGEERGECVSGRVELLGCLQGEQHFLRLGSVVVIGLGRFVRRSEGLSLQVRRLPGSPAEERDRRVGTQQKVDGKFAEGDWALRLLTWSLGVQPV